MTSGSASSVQRLWQQLSPRARRGGVVAAALLLLLVVAVLRGGGTSRREVGGDGIVRQQQLEAPRTATTPTPPPSQAPQLRRGWWDEADVGTEADALNKRNAPGKNEPTASPTPRKEDWKRAVAEAKATEAALADALGVPLPLSAGERDSDASTTAADELKATHERIRSLENKAAIACSSSPTSTRNGTRRCLRSSTPLTFFLPNRELPEGHAPPDPILAAMLWRLFMGHSVTDLNAGAGQYGAYFAWRETTSSTTNRIDYVGVSAAVNSRAFSKGLVSFGNASLVLATRKTDFSMWIAHSEGEEGEAITTQLLLNAFSMTRCCVAVSWSMLQPALEDKLRMLGLPAYRRRTDLDERRNTFVHAWIRSRFRFFCRKDASAEQCFDRNLALVPEKPYR